MLYTSLMKNFVRSRLNGIYKMCRFELLQLEKINLKNIYFLFFLSIRYQTQNNYVANVVLHFS